jgi:hypothetical protein
MNFCSYLWKGFEDFVRVSGDAFLITASREGILEELTYTNLGGYYGKKQ